MFRIRIEFTNPLWQEQWPYFKASPIAWLRRWFQDRRARPALHARLDAYSKLYAIHRKEGETDAELRARLLAHIRATPWQKVFDRHGIKDYELRQFGEMQVEVKTIHALTDSQKEEITRAICTDKDFRVEFWSIL